MTTKLFRKIHDIKPHLLEKNAAYLAGLIDGEGTFCLRKFGSTSLRFTPLISIAMSHEPTIAFAANVFGVSYGKIRRRKKISYHKDMFRLLVTTRKEIKQIAQALLPFAITKRKQIELMLSYLALEEDTSEKQNMKSKEKTLKEIDIYIDIKKENERGPPSDYEKIRKKLIAIANEQ